MGKRLGAGIPKALVDIDGKPLIIRQLEMLENYKNIKVVVGFQAEKVIEVVKNLREDVEFVYNNDYETTGTAASFSKGIANADEWVVAFDGDLLVNPDDLELLLNYPGEVIGGCVPTTDNPVLMTIKDGKVVSFSRNEGDLEWTGLAKLKKERLEAGDKHVYMMMEPILPIDVLKISTREIDTQQDYENALIWIRNGCK